MNVVTLILPKDRTKLEEKYSELLADIVCKQLNNKEIEYLITKLENSTSC